MKVWGVGNARLYIVLVELCFRCCSSYIGGKGKFTFQKISCISMMWVVRKKSRVGAMIEDSEVDAEWVS